MRYPWDGGDHHQHQSSDGPYVADPSEFSDIFFVNQKYSEGWRRDQCKEGYWWRKCFGLAKYWGMRIIPEMLFKAGK